MNDRSIVEYFSGHEGYRCGYCKSENSSYSYGMWAHTLSPLNYQNLIDRGWRRSGKYCYKPNMQLICCPQYSIRCEANKFNLSRSQKKVLKKVNRYLTHGERLKITSSEYSESGDNAMDISVPEAMDLGVLKNVKEVSEICRPNIEAARCDTVEFVQPVIEEKSKKTDASLSTSTKIPVADSCHSNIPSHKAVSTSKSNSNRPTGCKAKELRRERKLQKLLNKGVPAHEALSSLQKKSCESKTIENFLCEPLSSEPMNKLELRLVPSVIGNPLFMQTFEESYSVYKKYQMTIHKDPPEKCSENQYIRFLVKNPFQRLDGVYFSETSIYGSFHQQYWLNDKLIAVGVLDVLPYCVSSVYFYYDPDYSFLSLGTYSALREIAFTREMSKTHPDIQYYYMGFYVHSCIKMRYKGQYYPSFLLCPETYIYQPIDKCKQKLDIAKYHRLEEDPLKEDTDGIVNLSEVLILHNYKQMTYTSYRKFNKNADDKELVEEYAKFVGRKCYPRMMLFRKS